MICSCQRFTAITFYFYFSQKLCHFNIKHTTSSRARFSNDFSIRQVQRQLWDPSIPEYISEFYNQQSHSHSNTASRMLYQHSNTRTHEQVLMTSIIRKSYGTILSLLEYRRKHDNDSSKEHFVGGGWRWRSRTTTAMKEVSFEYRSPSRW